MRFTDYELIPSVVQDSKDPECLGRIKCVIPGKIHHDSCKTTEHMPWIRPFKMGGYQTFSKEVEGHKVWVLHNKKEYNEYWYIPIHEPINITQDFLHEHYNDNPEVLLARNEGAQKVMMRYDDQTGFMYEIGDDFINLNTKGLYEVKCSDGRIAIENSIVKLGSYSDQHYEQAVKGNTLSASRKKIAGILQKMVSTACGGNDNNLLAPYLCQIISELSCDDFLAENTTLN